MNQDTPIPTSIQAYNSYGVSPNHLRFMINNLFYFPDSFRDTLQTYFLQELETHEFLEHMREGTYLEEGCKYQVIYHKTDPTKLLRRKDHTTVKLSFREAAYEFNLIPTVLVKEVLERRE